MNGTMVYCSVLMRLYMVLVSLLVVGVVGAAIVAYGYENIKSKVLGLFSKIKDESQEVENDVKDVTEDVQPAPEASEPVVEAPAEAAVVQDAAAEQAPAEAVVEAPVDSEQK